MTYLPPLFALVVIAVAIGVFGYVALAFWRTDRPTAVMGIVAAVIVAGAGVAIFVMYRWASL